MSTKRRVFFYILGAYLTGAASMIIYLVWSSISDGGLERQHDLRQLLIIALFLTIYSLLWPYVIIGVFLIYLGVIHP